MSSTVILYFRNSNKMCYQVLQIYSVLFLLTRTITNGGVSSWGKRQGPRSSFVCAKTHLLHFPIFCIHSFYNKVWNWYHVCYCTDLRMYQLQTTSVMKIQIQFESRAVSKWCINSLLHPLRGTTPRWPGLGHLQIASLQNHFNFLCVAGHTDAAGELWACWPDDKAWPLPDGTVNKQTGSKRCSHQTTTVTAESS